MLTSINAWTGLVPARVSNWSLVALGCLPCSGRGSTPKLPYWIGICLDSWCSIEWHELACLQASGNKCTRLTLAYLISWHGWKIPGRSSRTRGGWSLIDGLVDWCHSNSFHWPQYVWQPVTWTYIDPTSRNLFFMTPHFSGQIKSSPQPALPPRLQRIFVCKYMCQFVT